MEWISVKDRFPKNNACILGLIKLKDCDDLLFAEGTYHKEMEGNWFFPSCDLTWEMSCEVTHWMPLPSPPKD